MRIWDENMNKVDFGFTWKQTSSEEGSMSQPSLLGLIRTVLLPNQVMMSMTGLALRMTTVSLS